MKKLVKLSYTVALVVALFASSCSVEYKNRHGRRHNVIDVGMNDKPQANESAVTPAHNLNIALAGR